MLSFVLNIFYIYAVSFVFLQEVCGRRHHHVHVNSRPKLYLNEFTVKIDGNNDLASAIAQRNGFINLGQVGELEGWYTFRSHKIRKRSLELHDRSQKNLRSLKHDVLFVERLKVLSRPKRDHVLSFSYQSPNDPSWPEMWYMHCGGANTSGCPCSMRITDAWRAKYNGEGVVVTILDDGIERTHPDLIENYDPDASRDINDKDFDPMPRYDISNENKHGTRCAGVVAASLNNQICGAGVAFRASIGGIRMLDGDVTDKVEALSLTHATNHTDIYSASWGPDDDGVTVEGPGPLAKAAFEVGALKGRGGKGSIFIWASGNGGHNRDSCSCDGYINTIYTIGISSVSQFGYRPWYLESCASTLASTYSSGDTPEGKVITTDLRGSCTHEHTGTSASAPMAAGVVALMLQANPELTWRDVQHVIVRTSKAQGLRADDWVVNGAGYKVSHIFGFGLLDAAAATHVASRWREVPEQKKCMTDIQRVARDISPLKRVLLMMTSSACHNQDDEIGYLEHVVLRISLSYSRRGELNIFLTSPSGTKSNILEKRHFDRSKAGFHEWEFMTTHHWGESASGVWKLQIEDNISSRQHRDTNRHGQLIQWQLIFYGTRTDPQPGFHFESCDAFPQDQCHAECVGCCGETAWECRSCRNFKTTEGKCVEACSSNEYDDESEHVCRSCWPTCLTCRGPTDRECTSCSHGYAIVNGACVKICNQGQYLEGSTQTCRQCDEVCKTCQGRSSRCTSCRESYIFEENTCRPSCPDGKFFHSNQVGCAPCHRPCRTCSHSPTRCHTCVSGFVRFRQRCLPSCPQRLFANPETNICEPCHRTCQSCSGPNRNECTRCSTNQLLQNGVCTRACTDAQIGNFGQNHCLYLKKLGLCLMDFFSQLCCKTCELFTDYDAEFYEYYLDELVYDEDANVEEQSADNSTISLPLVGSNTSLPET